MGADGAPQDQQPRRADGNNNGDGDYVVASTICCSPITEHHTPPQRSACHTGGRDCESPQPQTVLAGSAAGVVRDGQAVINAETDASYSRAIAAFKADHGGQSPWRAGQMIKDRTNGRVHLFHPPREDGAEEPGPENDLAIGLMLLHAIHLDEVFVIAKRLLLCGDLGYPGESAFQATWQLLCDHHDRTGHLPDYEMFLADVENLYPPLGNQTLWAIHTEPILDFARWLFVDAVKPTHVDEGLRLLREFLVRRKHDRPMRQLLNIARHPRRNELEKQYAEERRKIEEACQFGGVDTDVSLEALTSGTYTHNWLIKNVLVEGSPMIVGGPKKALKTSILLDLAVSLGIGEGVTFLNHHRFRVEKQVAVGMYSGESNQPTVATTVKNICFEEPQAWGIRGLPPVRDAEAQRQRRHCRRDRVHKEAEPQGHNF